MMVVVLLYLYLFAVLLQEGDRNIRRCDIINTQNKHLLTALNATTMAILLSLHLLFDDDDGSIDALTTIAIPCRSQRVELCR